MEVVQVIIQNTVLEDLKEGECFRLSFDGETYIKTDVRKDPCLSGIVSLISGKYTLIDRSTEVIKSSIIFRTDYLS